MARPRIFVSSTFYDLKQIRNDLEVFIKDLGYEPVMYERGHVPYGKTEKLEEYAYKEVEHCDVLVAIIGGRYGAASNRPPHSISQAELLTALKAGKQVYIFIEKSVYAEYRTFLANKGNTNTKYHFADNVAIYEFIEACEGLPNNNQIHGFESSQDIIGILREQWAGLFQRYLMESMRRKEGAAIQDIEATARTLKDLVNVFTKSREDMNKQAQDLVLLTNHPVFARLKKLLKVQYRVFFTTRQELNKWLDARNFEPVSDRTWDDPSCAEWITKGAANDASYKILRIPVAVFDAHDQLRPESAVSLDEESVSLREYESGGSQAKGGPDDIPF